LGFFIGDFHTDYYEKDAREIPGEENASAEEKCNQLV
jgi:hypothetical protein